MVKRGRVRASALGSAGAGVLALVVAACGTASSSPPPTSQPSPAGSTTAPAPSAAELPQALRYRWTGDPRDVPNLGTSTKTGLNFTGSTFALTGTTYGFDGVLGSSAALVGNELALTLTSPAAGCAAGDSGRYAWSLSPGETVLTISPGTDPCAARAAAMPGTWARMACKIVESGCLGDLEAGVRRSQYFDPYLRPGVNRPLVLGELTFEVPEGWSNSLDFPFVYTLTPSIDYALEGPDGPIGTNVNQVSVYPSMAPVVDVSTCGAAAPQTGPRTARSMIEYLQHLPGLHLGDVATVSIDGHAGRSIDVRLANDWKKTCPDAPDGLAGMDLLADASGHTHVGEAIGILGPERLRFTFIDLGDGAVVTVVVDSFDPDRFESLVASAMPIIESFRFK